MGFWSFLDRAIGFRPVKDFVDGTIEYHGDHEEANKKYTEASIDFASNVITISSLGTAKKTQTTKLGEQLLHRRKKKDGPEPHPNDEDPPVQEDPNQGHHVINKGVLTMFKDIIEKYISDHSHCFFGMSYRELVERGYIMEGTSLSQSHDRPLPDDIENNIMYIMKADTPAGQVHVDPNDLIFSTSKAVLLASCLDIIESVIHAIDETGRIDATNRYIINSLASLVSDVESINQELVQNSNGIFVDEQARLWWVNENSINQATFENSRDAVRNMFMSITVRGQGSPQNVLVYKWAQELYSVTEALIRDHHGQSSRCLYQLKMAPIMTLAKDMQPTEAAKLGHQTNGADDLWCAVANTKWGKIPGKAKGNTCWYPYGGQEYYTSDFRWLDSSHTMRKIKRGGSVPDGAVCSGFQTDGAGNLYSAVAVTRWGEIPGKAKGNTCWYPYGCKEYTTTEFYWVVRGTQKMKNPMLTLEHNAGPPKLGLKLGHQNDGAGSHWCAVADTKWGLIPGKAKEKTCWYSYGGKEYETSNFYWLDSASTVATVINKGHLPGGAIQCGLQNDGSEEFFAAIANTKWGTIPGKAKDNGCWYPYGGKEYHTTDFVWVVVK